MKNQEHALPTEVACKCGHHQAITQKQASVNTSTVCHACRNLIYFDFPKPCRTGQISYALGTYYASCACGWNTGLLRDEAEARQLRNVHAEESQ